MAAIEQVSAGGIVVRPGSEGIKVLLIEDRFGYWTWPKGHLEKGETLQEAALREIEEETGITGLDILCEAGIQKYSFLSGQDEIRKTAYIFLMESKGDTVVRAQTQEIARAGWFSAEEALDKIGYEGSRAILTEAISKFLSGKDQA